jgi:hypothetical protein
MTNGEIRSEKARTEWINQRSINATPTFILFVLYSFVSQYMLLTLLAGIALVLIVNLIYKPYIPPVVVYLFFFHWIQVFAAILYCDFLGQTFEEVFESIDTDYLFAVTMLQICAMVYLYSRVNKIKFIPSLETLEKGIDSINIKKLLTAYLVSTLIFPTLIAATYSNASISQIVLSFAVLRKVLLLMLIFIAFLKKTKYTNLIIGIIILEFILSFASYFSNFKEIIICVVLVYLTVKPYVKSRQVVRLMPFGIIFIVFMSFWSSVKDSYRSYLNGGTRSQFVSVSSIDALDFLTTKAAEFSVDSMNTGSELLLHRVQYMQQYSLVYSRVPKFIPFGNGKNLTETITFLLVPRILVGEKKILDPSLKTSYYTGKTFANAEQGTSISMGYFCDLYVDFGLWLMFIPLLLITYGIAAVSNYIINSDKYNILFTYSLFIGTILSLGTFESDIIFYLGSIRNYAVFMILGNYLLFPWLNRYIRN